MNEFLTPAKPDDQNLELEITPDGRVIKKTAPEPVMPGQPVKPPEPVQPFTPEADYRAMTEYLDSTGFVDEKGDPIVYDHLPTGVGEHSDDE